MRYRLARGEAEVETAHEWLRLAAATPALLWMPWLAGRLISDRRRPGNRSERAWARLVVRALRVRLEIEGTEHIETDTRYLVVALHEGVIDPVALLHLPLDLRFVVRDELLAWRYFGRYLQTSGQIHVRPEAGAVAYRRMLAAAAAARDSLVVFPQGTLLGIETEFQRGAFHLASCLSLPLLPVVLTGGHRVWERPFGPRVRLGQRVGMRVLPPVPADRVASAPPGDLRSDLQALMKRHALDGSMPAPRRYRPERDGHWPGYRYTIDPAYHDVAAGFES